MTVTPSGSNPSLSYVLTMAARRPAAETASPADAGVNGTGNNPAAGGQTVDGPAIGSVGAAQTSPSTASSKDDALLKMISFLKDPTSVTYERRRISPSAARPMTSAELARTKADLDAQRAFQAKYPAPPVDPNEPVRVRDLSSYPADMLPSHYLMMRSIVLNRQAAGQSTTIVEGREGKTVDAAEYLERSKQAAITSLEAKISINKTA